MELFKQMMKQNKIIKLKNQKSTKIKKINQNQKSTKIKKSKNI